MISSGLFQSFFIGDLDPRLTSKRSASATVTDSGLDITADYRRLQQLGISTVRSRIPWHLIESWPGYYDFSSLLRCFKAAHETRMQLIWYLHPDGYPADIDIFKPEFVRRLADMVSAFAAILRNETDSTPFIAPLNEISSFAWAAGEMGYRQPFAQGRSLELKVQMVRAAIEAIEAIWLKCPGARIIHPDLVINTAADPNHPADHPLAEWYRLAQYQVWDMISGRAWPQLGGTDRYLDIVGLTYCHNNPWRHSSSPDQAYLQYQPFRAMLRQVYDRYKRPLLVAEPRTRSEARPEWLHTVCQEVRAAQQAGVPVDGLCLYPLFEPVDRLKGWVQSGPDHHHNNEDDDSDRGHMNERLAAELRGQQQRFQQARSARPLGLNKTPYDVDRLAVRQGNSAFNLFHQPCPVEPERRVAAI